ncbi:MAG TPA: CDP-diacylglycerol--glycerol-3-phosphate 3-phosphatidyltransferase [Anaerovoracaceae bacterium]|nr:CDP-diacylglycerol--glycerol-3-phosphate 3-phosphatidyltransferase [Anaerovoracaceae bacterium]
MNLPNIITALRFALIPVFVKVFFSSMEESLLYSILIFLLAGVTDVLDGYIARKYDIVTKWGQAMDPLADKLMQLSVLVCFTIKRFIPPWVIAIYGIKELLMIFGGIFLYTKKNKMVLPANSYGKIATVVFYISILAVAFNFIYAKFLVVTAILFALHAFIQYAIIGIKYIKNPRHSIH